MWGLSRVGAAEFSGLCSGVVPAAPGPLDSRPVSHCDQRWTAGRRRREIGERGDVSWQVNDWLIQWAHADELEQQQHALHEGRVRAAGPRSTGFLVLTSEHVQLSVRQETQQLSV